MGGPGLSIQPVYNPATFKAGTILGGISLAAMTYIGFDGLTTLAEDSINPKRDMRPLHRAGGGHHRLPERR